MGFSRFIFLKVWNSDVEYQLKGRQKKSLCRISCCPKLRSQAFLPQALPPRTGMAWEPQKMRNLRHYCRHPESQSAFQQAPWGIRKPVELEKCSLRQGSRPWLHPATTSGSGRDPQGWVAPERLLGLVCGAHGIRVLEATPLPKAENHYPKVVAGSPQLFLRLADRLCSVPPYSNAPSPPQAIPRDGRWLLSLGIFRTDTPLKKRLTGSAHGHTGF